MKFQDYQRMNKEVKKELVPKLRFPEFLDSEKWDTKSLKFVCNMQAGKFVSASEIKDTFSDELYPCFGGNGLRGFVKSFTHSGKYSLIGRQGALCGNINLVSGEFHATEHAVVVTPNNGVNTDWLYYKLVFSNLNQYATGQAQPGLSVENLEKVKITIPLEEKEQTKIAACLSSLDDLITAQTQKIEALKNHKKGLMQQLFPQEGETVPKLRFPEFRDSGEWEIKTLNEVTSYVDYRGKTPEKSALGVFLVTAKNIRQGYIDYEISKEYIPNETYEIVMNRGKPKIGDVLITTEAPLGNVANIDREDIALAQRVIKLRGKTELMQNYFLKFYLLSEQFQKKINEKATGGTAQGIKGSTLHKMELTIPSIQEQQKIADCLSSLDDLINAHVKKCELLKTHKKGLMQGLFPSSNE